MKSKSDKDYKSVWVIEDNPHFRRTLVELINQSEDYRCAGFYSSCEEAFNFLSESEPPEIILLDIGLPGISGLDGIKMFKEISPSTLILILTIHDDHNSVFEAISSGASGYLLKDSSPEKVINAFNEVLSGGASINPQIAKKVIERFKEILPATSNYHLTSREKEILKHLVEGLNKKQIAEKLFLSFHTVNTHIKNIYEKLQVNTRSAVVSKAYKEKLF
ncbi:MAG: response regulator transcription factor [bacterium]|nr:response regulator transcription factor [bacterium]